MSTITEVNIDRNEAIRRIREGLKRRSGKAWSVTGGRGTAYGWITVAAPPARMTWRTREKAGTLGLRPEDYEEYDSGAPNGHMGPEQRAELATLLGLHRVHQQGVSIPSSNAYYVEHIDRAEGREPSRIGEPYWD